MKFILALLTMLSVTALARTNNNAYIIPTTGNLPTWGKLNLSSANAITGVCPIINGCTGQSTAVLGFNALSPLTSKGDLIGFDGTNNVRLPGGTNGQILTYDTTQTTNLKWAAGASNTVQYMANVGLTATVSASALTVTLTDSTGGTISAGDQATMNFRNATSATGQYSSLNISSPLTIVVPSGATLGQASGMPQYVWVYALSDAGTPDICVSGVTPFFDKSLNPSTAISAGATSGSTLYCASSHTGGKPTRIIGSLLVNEATAGTWSSAPSEIAIQPQVIYNSTDWLNQGNVTITSTGVSPTKGTSTTTQDNVFCRRNGSEAEIRIEYGHTTVGTATSGTGDYLFALPAACGVIDTTKVTAYTSPTGDDTQFTLSSTIGNSYGSSAVNGVQVVGSVVVYDSTHVRGLGNQAQFAGNNAAPTFWGATVTAFGATGVYFAMQFTVPIFGWSAYGP